MTRAKEPPTREFTARVLLYSRSPEDTSVLRELLAGMAAEGVVCADVQDLGHRLVQEDVDAVILTEWTLTEAVLPLLAQARQDQPSWSDLPILFVAGDGSGSPRAAQVMQELPNVLILERPLRSATLTSVLKMALRMRDRQRQVHALLDEQERTAQALHAQTDERAAVNEQLLTEREELRRQSDEIQQQSLELRQLKEQTERTAHAMEGLARLVEENPDPALRVKPDGRIQYGNPASLELRQRWNRGDKDRVPPAVQRMVSEAYAQVKVIRREVVFGERAYLVTAAAAPDLAHSINLFVSDITERKQAEEALRESHARLKKVLEIRTVGVMFWDLQSGRLLDANDTFFALMGYRRRDLETGELTWQKLTPPEYREVSTEAVRQCLATGRFGPFEKEYLRQDGTRQWFVFAGSLLDSTTAVEFCVDISARKRVEKSLRESEERLHLALEAARMGVWQWEVGTPQVAWSAEIYGLLGYDPGQVTPTHEAFRRRIHPEDLPRWEQAMREALERCEDYSCEFRVVWADGSVHWMEARGQYTYTGDQHAGKTVWIRGILSDIEQRKHAEEALHASEQRYRKLFEANLAGVYVTKLDGTILDFNDAMRRMLGYDSRAEVFAHRSTDFFADPAFRNELLRLLHRDGVVPAREAVLRRKDGSLLYALGAGALLRDEQTGEPYIQGVALDITDRKQAEEALRESEQRLHSHMENSPLAVVEWDKDFVVTRWAGEAEKMFGWTAAETVGKSIRALNMVHPDDAPVVARVMERLTDGVSRHVVSENRNVTRTGTVRHCVWYNSVLLDTGGKMSSVLSLVQDVTEQKQAQEALREWNATLEGRVAQRTDALKQRTRQLQKLAREVSEAEERERERLAHILHDDLQQELAAAKFHLSLVRSRIQQDPSVQEITLQVDGMLKDAIAKSRSLSHELSPAALRQDDFGAVLSWLADEMQDKHGLTVRVQGQARVPSDPIKAILYRTAQELLFNAVKHAQVHEARVRVRPCGGYVVLVVSDRGRGFSPESLRETAGFGLLSIRERIELLGGRMKIRSVPGRGSTFFVAVPNEAEAPDIVGVGPRAYPTQGGHGGPPLRVVLADDHDVVRQGLAALLGEEETIEVVGEAANGREAVDLAERLRPDVVVMDVSMPVMDGAEATRTIKRERPGTRIVSLSMREEPESRERMRAAGAETYVLKTAPYPELLAAIRGVDE